MKVADILYVCPFLFDRINRRGQLTDTLSINTSKAELTNALGLSLSTIHETTTHLSTVTMLHLLQQLRAF